MGRIVIVGYKPLPGKSADCEALISSHLPLLRSEGLATDREALLVRAQDGTLIEIFEWVSQDAINSAHSNPAVQALWEKFAKVCEYIPAGKVTEMRELFSEFEALN